MTHDQWMYKLQIRYDRNKIGYTQFQWDVLRNKRNFIITILSFETKDYHNLIYTFAIR